MPAAICVVSGTICNTDGTANSDIQVRARVERTNVDQGGQVASGVGLTDGWIVAFTDDAGAFSIDLVQGARVEFHIPGINLRKVITVPVAGSANFADLV